MKELTTYFIREVMRLVPFLFWRRFGATDPGSPYLPQRAPISRVPQGADSLASPARELDLPVPRTVPPAGFPSRSGARTARGAIRAPAAAAARPGGRRPTPGPGPAAPSA